MVIMGHCALELAAARNESSIIESLFDASANVKDTIPKLGPLTSIAAADGASNIAE